ncbi:hypothetical protein F5X99DRAFT_367175 [Biscogniauxia marginata]|nr:hypothetical protein F5X99DRAFT_367175 [Biscogniauxia marginata]
MLLFSSPLSLFLLFLLGFFSRLPVLEATSGVNSGNSSYMGHWCYVQATDHSKTRLESSQDLPRIPGAVRWVVHSAAFEPPDFSPTSSPTTSRSRLPRRNMSLHDDAAYRGRPRSPTHPAESADRSRKRHSESPSILDAVRMPSPPAGFSYDDAPLPRSAYDHGDSYRIVSPSEDKSYHRRSPETRRSPDENPRYARRARDSSPPRKSKPEVDVVDVVQETIRRSADAFMGSKYASRMLETDNERKQRKQRKKEQLEDDLAYGSTASLTSTPRHSRPEFRSHSPSSSTASFRHSVPGQWEYHEPEEALSHSRQGSDYAHRSDSRYHRDSYGPGPKLVDADPTSRPGSRRNRSPKPPTARMSTLTVNTGHHPAALSLSSGAPASPLLESYHGTYQSMSPMPSPLLLASNGPGASGLDVVEPLSPGMSDGENGDKKKRRARFHDPVDDAARLAKALKGERRAPETEPLIEILPGMTHEQIMNLRSEYKRLVKTGPERKGVNLAKHIRARLKDEDPILMKACYATALGRWESEAYWANFWYQGDKTRRELLIESLMGHSNDEIRLIKDAFSDKKYRDSLTLCMRTELKEDKFKKAVLLALEAKRMEDKDESGRPLLIDRRLVEDDVEALYKAVHSDKGGETAMIQIVLLRSDTHLREVLKLYEKVCRSNFARDALKKSGNLVGELLAHILNGVINKPVRDALLLHHALKTSKDSLRRELLISRLVRYHWDRQHLTAIKRAFRERYGEDLTDAVREGTSGEWGTFCEQLCVTRMPGEVKQFDTVETVKEVRKDDRDREKERDAHERLREREREKDHEREKERDRSRDREREERKREKERQRQKEKERGRSEGHLEVKEHKHKDRSQSRERSRSRRRE